MTRLNRRRFLTISAAAALAPAVAPAAPAALWRGRAMGAQASMRLVGVDPQAAQPIFAAVEAELARLEAIFSLYHAQSEVSRLNRDGHLANPSPELLEVLSLSSALHAATGGRFDPTVQPVWLARAQGAGPEATARARAAVGWHHLRFDPAGVRFDNPQDGPALTLNGIAQGAVTDRIAALLETRGLRDVLVDMGELRAIGQTRWPVGIAAPDGEVIRRLSLSGQALATSAPAGTRVGPGADQPHILAPDGRAAPHALISVTAPGAALADGLSTALCLAAPDQVPQIMAQFPQARLRCRRLA